MLTQNPCIDETETRLIRNPLSIEVGWLDGMQSLFPIQTAQIEPQPFLSASSQQNVSDQKVRCFHRAGCHTGRGAHSGHDAPTPAHAPSGSTTFI
jgi:hypothetical protein